jgi:hypothetical protein
MARGRSGATLHDFRRGDPVTVVDDHVTWGGSQGVVSEDYPNRTMVYVIIGNNAPATTFHYRDLIHGHSDI